MCGKEDLIQPLMGITEPKQDLVADHVGHGQRACRNDEAQPNGQPPHACQVPEPVDGHEKDRVQPRQEQQAGDHAQVGGPPGAIQRTGQRRHGQPTEQRKAEVRLGVEHAEAHQHQQRDVGDQQPRQLGQRGEAGQRKPAAEGQGRRKRHRIVDVRRTDDRRIDRDAQVRVAGQQVLPERMDPVGGKDSGEGLLAVKGQFARPRDRRVGLRPRNGKDTSTRSACRRPRLPGLSNT